MFAILKAVVDEIPSFDYSNYMGFAAKFVRLLIGLCGKITGNIFLKDLCYA